MTALSRLIDARISDMEVTNKVVSELSERCPSGTISEPAVAKYRTGRHPAVPTDRLMRVLSWVLQIPLLELQRAAGVRESREPYVPPPEAHQLPRAHRDVVTALIKLLAAAPSAAEDETEATGEGVWSMDIPDDAAGEDRDAANGHTPGQGNGD